MDPVLPSGVMSISPVCRKLLDHLVASVNFMGIPATLADKEIAASLGAQPIVAAAAAEDVITGCAAKIVRGITARLCAGAARRRSAANSMSGHEDEACEEQSRMPLRGGCLGPQDVGERPSRRRHRG
jgi:hypothetical protein